MEQFGLNTGQIANFLSNPQIQNILGRVVGGTPSVINGLIQVSGGNSNLYLMNPAGMIFGTNAQLDVPAAFTATTATSIGFSNGNWFQALGSNDYQNLVGTPSQFTFNSPQPAAIVNEGKLTVAQGQTFNLLANTLINLGEINAPGGRITIAAVEGEKVVRISQEGHVLSLDIPLPVTDDASVNLPFITVSTLPAQLTGGNLHHATQLVTNADGTIQLTGNNGHLLNSGQLSTSSNNQGGEINLTGRLLENRGQIMADGTTGGKIKAQISNLLDTGTLSAVGSSGSGGEIAVNYSGRVIQTATALTSVSGSTSGGVIAFNGGADTILTTSGNLEATGETGGKVYLFAQDIRLLATSVDASGNSGGGEILVGGDYQGNTQFPILNSSFLILNSQTTLNADALTTGNGGKIIVWSDQLTEFYGSATARGGNLSGDGGLLEVSGKNELVFAGMGNASAVNGAAGQLLLDPKNITIDSSVTGSSFPLFDPNPAAGNQFGQQIGVLRNGNIVVSAPFDDLTALDAGAVYLFNPDTGALLGAINGAVANDNFGNDSIKALGNGNYVFGNPAADIGGIVNAGTVILADGTTGTEISRISGTFADDNFGNGTITALDNSNYVFGNPNADTVDIPDAGTVILADGATGVEINRISGTQAGDNFGSDSIEVLSNSNYVFGNPNADVVDIPDVGTVILVDGITGTEISRISGILADDNFGSSEITPLDNGNYVFGNPNANIAGIADAGTVILANGTTGIEINRISGTVAADNFGSSDITALNNNNFVFSNPNADIAGIADTGTVILANGTTGTEINRISGTVAADNFGNGDITALANGNFVFGNPSADIGGIIDAGTVILANGNTGAEINRISGTNPNDSFTGTLTNKTFILGLSNGNFVFSNPVADIGGIIDAGTVILANGTTGAEINRISGTNPNDNFGDRIITALSNGNFVFRSPDADLGGIADTGTVILADGTTGIEINRIFGTNPSDRFGSGRVKALANGNYLIASPLADREAGRVDIGIANPSSLTYNYFPDRNITINPQLLTHVADTGTAVTLQANNDITLNNPITINNPNGNGGELTFQAGRSLVLNADITTDNGNLNLIANNTAANGVVAAQRDGGNAVITLAPGVTLNSGTGNTTIRLDTGAGLTNNGSGDITLAGNIIARNLTVENQGVTGGGVNIQATANLNPTVNLTVNTAGGNILFNSPTLTANTFLSTGVGTGNITLNNTLDSSSGTENLTLTAGTGNVSFSGIVGSNTPLGNLTIISAADVTANNSLTATSFTHTAGTGTINLADLQTLGGDVQLTTSNNLTTGKITTAGGDIRLTSQTGAINTGNLNSSAATGGEIFLDAQVSITTGEINSSGNLGNGGNITLDPLGDVQISLINAQGGSNGTGGNIRITAGQFFRATDSFTDSKGILASISTAGGLGGGDITIRHGGNGLTPFDVGDATTNGTAAAITSGDTTITPFQSFPFSYTQGNIQILSIDSLTNTPGISPDPTPGSTNSTLLSINPIDLTRSQPAPDNLVEQEIPSVEIDTVVEEIEARFTNTLENYLGIGDAPTALRASFGRHVSTPLKNLKDARTSLKKIQQATGVKPALIYAVFTPTITGAVGGEMENGELRMENGEWGIENGEWRMENGEFSSPTTALSSPKNLSASQESGFFGKPQPTDELELVLVTADGKPIRHRVSGATRQGVIKVANQFRRNITNVSSSSYQKQAQQLYQWLVAPLAADLQAQRISNLTFILDTGLRSLPLAALHDGTGFIIERYSIGLMPSLSLTDTRYLDVRNTKMLAMGAAKFTDQSPLPAVPLELSTLTGQLWQGKSFLNQEFTLNNLKSARAAQPFGIVHLATHGEFREGKLSNSYIQLWDTKLQLNQMRELQLHNPPVELLVLSACRTALGNEEAELGFAGLAVLAGVKSALGSLWYVSDEGTMGLMTRFYQQLRETPIKAEALRQAQLAMLRGEVRLENQQLVTADVSIPLPPELAGLEDQELSHPYYWSAFTLIGSPW